MIDYDLMEDPEDELPIDDLRKRADRLLLLHEFAVAYQYPVPTAPDRGYLTAWHRTELLESDNPVYERLHGMSGDDDWIRGIFGEMAVKDTPDRIERFIGGEL